MDLMNIVRFEIGKGLSKVILLSSEFFEYNSCINYPKTDDNLHWYFLVYLLKNLIVFSGIKNFESIDSQWFSGIAFGFTTLLYSYLKPSISQVGYQFNTWSFVFIYLLLIYIVVRRVKRNELFRVVGVTIFAFFAEETITGIQFAVDCFIAFFSLRFTAEKLYSKLTGLPYALFFLFTFYFENFCLTDTGLGMLSGGMACSMSFVYLTKRYGNNNKQFLPIFFCCLLMFVYIYHYRGTSCMSLSVFGPRKPRVRPTVAPKDPLKMAAAINRAMNRLTATGKPILKMNLPPPMAD